MCRGGLARWAELECDGQRCACTKARCAWGARDLGGFFGLRALVLGDFGKGSVEFAVIVEDQLVIDFGFGEQNVPFVTLLLAVFGGLAEGEESFLSLLRFEANFRLAPFGSVS
jgi:hypothetical protein